jgi:hypothetical protein
VTRGRKPTAGRFRTRAELVEAVWREWLMTRRNQAQIARAFRVSDGVVASILKDPALKPPQQT